jgi:potassium/chloride transporter 9
VCTAAYYDWLRLVDHLRVKAFVELTAASAPSSLRHAIGHVMRMSGIGAMKPNTVVLGFRDETFHADDLASSQSPYKSDAFDGAFPDVRTGAAHQESDRFVGNIK